MTSPSGIFWSPRRGLKRRASEPSPKREPPILPRRSERLAERAPARFENCELPRPRGLCANCEIPLDDDDVRKCSACDRRLCVCCLNGVAIRASFGKAKSMAWSQVWVGRNTKGLPKRAVELFLCDQSACFGWIRRFNKCNAPLWEVKLDEDRPF